MTKILTAFHGFCMALADSVPGVSGGTIAFLMGFYDSFIGSLSSLISGTKEERISALKYLIKLGIGWVIGMVLAVLILSSLFESHIYLVSSLFIGFIVCAIPVVISEEKQCMKKKLPLMFFVLIGIAVVVLITYFNPVGSSENGFDVTNMTLTMYLYVFVAGAISICAMILPGISGSTLMLIFGLYVPIITGIRDLLHMSFTSLPFLIAFGLGVVTGVIAVIKMIQYALTKHRGAMLYLIIGLMIGSVYAIVMGPSTLDTPQPPMSLGTFNIIFFLIGAAIIIAMQLGKKFSDKKAANADKTTE